MLFLIFDARIISLKQVQKHVCIFPIPPCCLIIHLNVQVISLTLAVDTSRLATVKPIYHNYIWLGRHQNVSASSLPRSKVRRGYSLFYHFERICDGSRILAFPISWNLRQVPVREPNQVIIECADAHRRLQWRELFWIYWYARFSTNGLSISLFLRNGVIQYGWPCVHNSFFAHIEILCIFIYIYIYTYIYIHSYQISFNCVLYSMEPHHFANDTFKRIFLNKDIRLSIEMLQMFVPKCPSNNIPALVQIMT